MNFIKKASCFVMFLIISLSLLTDVFKLMLICEVKAISSEQKTGNIVVTVLENGTLTPIENATVCLIETREYYQTNKKGLTQKIVCPILKNTNFNATLAQTWGEVSFLVYKPGYADTVILHVNIFENSTRIGFIAYLTPIINVQDTTPNIFTEPPKPDWLTEVIKINKK